MGSAIKRRAPWWAVAVIALVCGTLAGPITAHPAMAGLVPCKSDPVVLLSNGAQLDLSASIGANLSSVNAVVYTVHVPVGTRVVALLNTDSLIGLVEQVNVYADEVSNAYDTYTTVKTGTGVVAITATSEVISALNLTVGLGSVTGYSSQTLHMHFAPLL